MMRTIDILIALIEAQAQVLQDLEELFGEEVLMVVLERSAERELELTPISMKGVHVEKAQGKNVQEKSPHSELQEAISGIEISKGLEFYLWGYPGYRYWVEGSLGLSDRLYFEKEEDLKNLGYQIAQHAYEWGENLGLMPTYQKKINQIIDQHWEHFPVRLMRKGGMRPLQLVPSET